jgi:hypothetical protein
MVSIFERLIHFLGGQRRGSQDGFVVQSTPSIEDQIEREIRAWSAFYNVLVDRSRRYFLSAVLGQTILDKQRMIEVVEAYKDTFFHQMIVNLLVDDALSVDPVTGNVVEITTVNETLKPIVEGLQERIDLDAFISSIVEDVVAYGDYVVRVVNDGRKVVALEDDIDQKKVVVVYKAGRPVCLVDYSEVMKNSDDAMMSYVEFLHFSVSPRKVRLKLPDRVYEQVAKEGFTEYVRIGKPLFWGLWDLLNSLYILMVFYPIFAVQKLNATTIVGVRVPPETSVQRAWEIARKYQELLNVYTTVDERGRVALVDVIDTIGRYKVVPIWGDEKGFVQLTDPRLEESFALDIVDELKVTLCASLGVPYSFLFGSREGATKLDTLKSFSRYVKKVASIQRAIREGLYQLVRIEARLNGLGDISVEEVDVRFRNALISTEHLDKLEFMAGMIDTVRSSVEAVNEIAGMFEAKVNKEKVIEFLNSYLGMVGLDGVLEVEKGVEGGVEGSMEGVGGDEFGVGSWVEDEMGLFGGEEDAGLFGDEEEVGLFGGEEEVVLGGGAGEVPFERGMR